ncbi:MAG: tRNA (adenosine(37)-N6)-threonylcarbamoyltransferase complex ATPase subunit type 1 TsaE [Proteobacteria bacterium]|nr:tRNA (adenosine(37)-N6)-threonylcarbamoyltransferase complex ATPase subunit type 1 TsaE [Pseudomonadota bacterium]
MIVRCPNPEDTEALGASLGRHAMPGTVVALSGDLGAGKTVFARGVGAGLGVTTRVQSPSYIIVQSHEGGRLPFAHADLYRLGDADELEQLGLDDVLDAGGMVLIEWAERFPEVLPTDHVVCVIREVADGRAVELSATGPSAQQLLEKL